MKRAINWLKEYKLESVASFIHQLTLELLSIHILRDEVELEYFLDYLKRPRTVSIHFTEDFRKELNANRHGGYPFDQYWYDAHQFNTALWPHDNTLIENYLSVYFKHNSDLNNIKQFEKYFTRDFLLKLIYKVRLEKGENTPDLHAVFSKD